jgi:hypothetical protein
MPLKSSKKIQRGIFSKKRKDESLLSMEINLTNSSVGMEECFLFPLLSVGLVLNQLKILTQLLN